MTIVIFLFLLVGTDPLPTFMILGNFPSITACEERVQELELTKEEQKRLSCTPVITSKLTET